MTIGRYLALSSTLEAPAVKIDSFGRARTGRAHVANKGWQQRDVQGVPWCDGRREGRAKNGSLKKCSDARVSMCRNYSSVRIFLIVEPW